MVILKIEMKKMRPNIIIPFEMLEIFLFIKIPDNSLILSLRAKKIDLRWYLPKINNKTYANKTQKR